MVSRVGRRDDSGLGGSRGIRTGLIGLRRCGLSNGLLLSMWSAGRKDMVEDNVRCIVWHRTVALSYNIELYCCLILVLSGTELNHQAEQ